MLCKIAIYMCGWLWENLILIQKDKHLEKCSWIIQSAISPEGLKLQACDLPHITIASYLRSSAICWRLPSPQHRATWLDFLPFMIVFINTTSTYSFRGGGWGVVGAMKWWVTAELSNFQREMAHKQPPLHSNCHKI